MRNMLLSVVIVTAVGTGACGGGADGESVSQATAVGSENSATLDSSAIAPTSGNSVAQAAESLPSTASSLPAIGAIGILFLGAAAFIRRHRRQLEYRHLGSLRPLDTVKAGAEPEGFSNQNSRS